MKIAAITVCFNDNYKLEEWYENFQYYKKSLYRLIIVDNGSKKEFLDRAKAKFSCAEFIERDCNGGLTAAYNEGIRIALKDNEVDSIMLLGNDILIRNDSIEKMYKFLFQEERIGMVAPVLLEKNSDLVSDAGADVSYCFFMKPYNVGKRYGDLGKENIKSKSLTGGINLAKRSFYEKLGLQDEKLFMYSDEVDMGTRAFLENIEMFVVHDAVAWHQHINPPGHTRRLPYSDYFMARNKIYLGRKHYGLLRAFIIFVFMIIRNCCGICILKIRGKSIEPSIYALKGAINGIRNKMDLPDYLGLKQ